MKTKNLSVSGGSLSTVFTNLEEVPVWLRKATRQDFALSAGGSCINQSLWRYSGLLTVDSISAGGT